MNSTEKDYSGQKEGRSTVLLAVAVVIVVGLISFTAIRFFDDVKSGWDSLIGAGERLANRAIDKAPEIAAKFKKGTITTTFLASLPRVDSTGGDVLELATVTSPQFFKRDDERSFVGIYRGKTVAEIQANATFRYYLKLSDKWDLTVESNRCIVLAPPFRPTLPPAFDTATLQKRAENGWARFDKSEQLDSLERDITKILSERAAEPLQMEAVRESCRKSVAEFVRNWLLKEDLWRKDRFASILVIFPDEYPQANLSELQQLDRRPTIQLEPN
jgi:hypothetical protein